MASRGPVPLFYMKSRFKIFLLMIILSSFAMSCSNEGEEVDYAASINAVKKYLDGHSLLKETTVKDGSYVLTFEDDEIEIDADAVQDLSVDRDSWVTTISFSNGTVLTVPTIGNSIDRYISKVTVNPTGYSPLTAKIAVDLPALGNIKVIVHSKPGKITPDVTHTFENNSDKSQIISVLGLYQGYENHVTLVYLNTNGDERSRSELTLKTDSLTHPHLPKSIAIAKINSDAMEPGMTLVNSPGESEVDTSIPFMIDADGEIRWALDWREHPIINHIGIGCGLVRMQNGDFVTGDGNNNYILEIDVHGDIVKLWNMSDLGYSFHHAVSETDEGHIMANVSKLTAKLANGRDSRVNDFIIELDPKEGTVLKEWDLVNMLDSARYDITVGGAESESGARRDQTATNWAHNNGILKIGDEYLSTARYQGIFLFNKNGGVKWVISPHKYWRKKYQNMLLTPLHADGSPITDQDVIDGTKGCDDFEWPWGVHSAVKLPNGDYLAFDNGYGRYFSILPPEGQECFSRAVEYEVDEENMTVRQVWQYGKELGNAFYAPARSSTQYLSETGNYLIGSAMLNDFGNGKYGCRIVEINPTTQEVVFEAQLEDAIFQRVIRLPIYPDNL
jgi:arylsulfate sulfotransferase